MIKGEYRLKELIMRLIKIVFWPESMKMVMFWWFLMVWEVKKCLNMVRKQYVRLYMN